MKLKPCAILALLLTLCLCLTACGSSVLYTKGTNYTKVSHDELMPEPEPEPEPDAPDEPEQPDTQAQDDIPELDAFSLYDPQRGITLTLGMLRSDVEELLGEPDSVTQEEENGVEITQATYGLEYTLSYQNEILNTVSVITLNIISSSHYYARDVNTHMSTEEVGEICAISLDMDEFVAYAMLYNDEGESIGLSTASTLSEVTMLAMYDMPGYGWSIIALGRLSDGTDGLF